VDRRQVAGEERSTKSHELTRTKRELNRPHEASAGGMYVPFSTCEVERAEAGRVLNLKIFC
jgi:hypothetical protein